MAQPVGQGNGLEETVLVQEIAGDLRAERESLHRFLATLTDDQWNSPTPADGWSVLDSVAHIAYIDDVATQLLNGDNSPLEETALAGKNYDNTGLGKKGPLAPAEVLEWLRQSGAVMLDKLLVCDPKARIPWFALPMGARSFATARLMETWAHGLDCYDATGITPVDTDRLRHVAFLAYKAMPYAYDTNNLAAPTRPIRFELTLPSGVPWTMGPEDAGDIISGEAGEFCRVAVRRRHWKDTQLSITGDAARQYVEIAQTYAGPPGSGRKPLG